MVLSRARTSTKAAWYRKIVTTYISSRAEYDGGST